MWVLKLKLSPEKFLLGSLAVKFNVDILGYPLSHYKDKKHLYLVSAGFLIGEEKNKKALIRYAKKSKDFIKIEVKNDFIINLSKQPLYTEPVYDPRLIRPKPVFISHEGYHIWEIAYWDKNPLLKIIDFAKKYHKGKVLKLKQEKLINIAFTTVLPELSEKQKKALELAVSEGYYTYPKKINVHKLAKLMKVSYSTFQEHLRKAEAKLIPILSNRL